MKRRVVLVNQESGLSFPQILEKNGAMTACTGADGRLRRSLGLGSRRLSG